MKFAVGSLVKSRGREWVVLPDSTEDTLILRPLGGTDAEVTGIHLPAGEAVVPATFALPDPTRVGDFHSCRLLREAVRLSIRSGAGPFRSLGAIAVEPRSYQIVPLLLALRLDPVRLLIADDVGIGKTVEASLIAKELLERGEVDGLTVLVPPHLAEQWQRDLREQFHIDAELVLPSTASRLERTCTVGQSLFDIHRHTVVSMEFIKSPRRRQEFLRTCPKLVLVDEAHGCAQGSGGRAHQQRFELLHGLAQDPTRHILLVTATPHSGNEEAFRSLLSLLDPDLIHLPSDLTGESNRAHREHLARYFVQRRRADIEHFLDEDTPFPKREEFEATYQLTPTYRRFFDKALAFARETVEGAGEDRRRQRVRWWSALALLRSIGSSPAAAAQTLRNRAPEPESEDPRDVDDIGERAVLDVDAESGEVLDVAPGADYADTETEPQRVRRRLLDLAKEADGLAGAQDGKLKGILEQVAGLVKDGLNPIVFCRFIPTAEYVAEHIRKKLGKHVAVEAVTGLLAPEDREARVAELAKATSRVLVCTDCLSEGINLQHSFDAVVHYDLSWNPTRHEQREGRVDRYGQPSKTVRTILYYGSNNPIDGLVLDVLLRKHKRIRTALGISVPVPGETSDVMKALAEGLLVRGSSGTVQGVFEFQIRGQTELHAEWERAGEREKRSRTLFAQQSIKPEEVHQEHIAARRAVGGRADVERFLTEALKVHGATVEQGKDFTADLSHTPRALRDILGEKAIRGRFQPPVQEGISLLTRTHPIVASLASFVLDSALDGDDTAVARRCGAMRTDGVSVRTTILLVRQRFHVVKQDVSGARPLLAEECTLSAFTGAPTQPTWLDSAGLELLLAAQPVDNISVEQARDFVAQVVAGYLEHLQPYLETDILRRADELLDAHRRVRTASKQRGVRYKVEPKLPVDVVGIYVLLPAARGGR